MRPAGHRIDIDPDREFMRVTLWGDWANVHTDGLSVAHAKAVLAMKVAGARHGHFLTLVDMREKTLTEEVTVAEFRKSFEANSPSRRTAIIVSPELPTSMADRIAPPGRVLITYAEGDALAWLFEPT